MFTLFLSKKAEKVINIFCFFLSRIFFTETQKILQYFIFNSFPIKFSGKAINYICQKCKYKFEAPIKEKHEFEEDEWSGLTISIPRYTIYSKCNYDKCVPIDYKSKRGFHHMYKENN